MTTIAQNIKNTALRFCLSLLFILGSAAFCQAQGVVDSGQIPGLDVPGPVPIQSSAPAPSGWEWSNGADMESIGVIDTLAAPVDVSGPSPIQSSAPALSGWVSSVGADMGMSIGVSDEMLVNFAAPILTPAPPATGLTFTPAISPEPSTISLLLAGSAALFRFGWRKRSN
jgi:hypothetical protein